jgi:stromal interaction molecule 1
LVQFDGDARREKIFHKKDDEITVTDLWQTWAKSEVYNWTVEQTAEWLVHSVDLPQYAQVFVEKNVTGAKLPLAASDPSFLIKVLGISNSIHRSKISLKAMDVVLFGPPKEPTNWVKDIIVSSLLVALLTALFWAYKQKMRSEEDIAKMMKDLESLTKAEKMLQDMQSKLAESQEDEEDEYHHHQQGSSSELEVDKLREEVEILRGELHRVEVELEDRCWMAPTILQVCVYGISRQSPPRCYCGG